MPKIIMSTPNSSIQALALGKHFAVLLDTRDKDWADNSWTRNKIAELLNAGGCYFVCFGSRSEFVHDMIDDLIVDCNYSIDIPTTFHNSESIEDIATFFLSVLILNEIELGLLLVRDKAIWGEMSAFTGKIILMNSLV